MNMDLPKGYNKTKTEKPSEVEEAGIMRRSIVNASPNPSMAKTQQRESVQRVTRRSPSPFVRPQESKQSDHQAASKIANRVFKRVMEDDTPYDQLAGPYGAEAREEQLDNMLKKYAEQGSLKKIQHIQKLYHPSTFDTEPTVKSRKFETVLSRDERNKILDKNTEGAPFWKYWPKHQLVERRKDTKALVYDKFLGREEQLGSYIKTVKDEEPKNLEEYKCPRLNRRLVALNKNISKYKARMEKRKLKGNDEDSYSSFGEEEEEEEESDYEDMSKSRNVAGV